MTMTNPDEVVTKQDLHDFYEQIKPYLGSYPVAIANKFSKGDIYSNTEKVIGQWHDGRPLYQKVINFGNLPNKTDKSVAHGINNLDVTACNVSCWCTQNGLSLPIPLFEKNFAYGIWAYASTTNVIIQTKENFSTATAYVILKYTKTTDSAISIGSETDYSTTEKIVGTWIDGKPIYQKTFTGTLTKTSTQGTEVSTDVSTGVSVDKYVDANGWAYNSSTGTFQKFNLFNNNESASYGLRMTCNNNLHSSKANKVVLANSWFTVDTTYYLTLQYTKV